MPMNIAEKWLKERLEATSPGRKLIHARLSNLTEDKPDQGRSRCQFRNQCGRGCSFGPYFSPQAATLPPPPATVLLIQPPHAGGPDPPLDPTPTRDTRGRPLHAKHD